MSYKVSSLTSEFGLMSTYRGKDFGHDVDLLLSHPDHNVTESLLDTLVDHLKRQVIQVLGAVHTFMLIFHLMI